MCNIMLINGSSLHFIGEDEMKKKTVEMLNILFNGSNLEHMLCVLS